MGTISLQGRVDRDGLLRLEVPVSLRNEDVEVVVVVQAFPNGHGAPASSPAWVDELYGSCPDLARPEQGRWEEREEVA